MTATKGGIILVLACLLATACGSAGSDPSSAPSSDLDQLASSSEEAPTTTAESEVVSTEPALLLTPQIAPVVASVTMPLRTSDGFEASVHIDFRAVRDIADDDPSAQCWRDIGQDHSPNTVYKARRVEGTFQSADVNGFTWLDPWRLRMDGSHGPITIWEGLGCKEPMYRAFFDVPIAEAGASETDKDGFAFDLVYGSEKTPNQPEGDWESSPGELRWEDIEIDIAAAVSDEGKGFGATTSPGDFGQSAEIRLKEGIG